MKTLSESKHSLAIKCNNNCLKEFFKQVVSEADVPAASSLAA